MAAIPTPHDAWTYRSPEPRSTVRSRGIHPSERGLRIVDITEFYSERGGGIRSHLTQRRRHFGQCNGTHVLIASGPRDENGDPGSTLGRSRLVRIGGPAMPYDRTYHLLYRLDRVRRCVRAEEADVLEVHSPYLATAALLASGQGAARLKTAFWHSDHVGVHLEPVLSACLGSNSARVWSDRVRQRTTRALLAPFDLTFAAGRSQVLQLRAAGVERVVHAPFGVDTQVFKPQARSADWRRRWQGQAGEDAIVLVGSGRLAAEKRWDVVMDAFARTQSRRPATFVLFGDGPERARLERKAPRGFRFAGFERDPTRLATALASADVLVHAAPHETFGIAIAEAIACGLPIVVPDGGAAAEHLEIADGAVYPSLDARACAAMIEAVVDGRDNDARARSLDAAARVRTHDQHFRHVASVYADLLHELGR